MISRLQVHFWLHCKVSCRSQLLVVFQCHALFTLKKNDVCIIHTGLTQKNYSDYIWTMMTMMMVVTHENRSLNEHNKKPFLFCSLLIDNWTVTTRSRNLKKHGLLSQSRIVWAAFYCRLVRFFCYVSFTRRVHKSARRIFCSINMFHRILRFCLFYTVLK